MTLDDLQTEVADQYSELDDELTVSLDRETRNELAMLSVALDPEDTDELLRRAVHMLFQSTVDEGPLTSIFGRATTAHTTSISPG